MTYASTFQLNSGGCANMVLKIPADGWYIAWYMVRIPSQARWVVRDGNVQVGEFTGDGTTSFYPILLELGSGNHVLRACNSDNRSAYFFMSGAYDLP